MHIDESLQRLGRFDASDRVPETEWDDEGKCLDSMSSPEVSLGSVGNADET